MLPNRRLLAAVFLVLCSVPLCAEAQQYVCWPIARGDTAFGLARRLTGTTATTYGEAFQIRDPARRKFLPKSQYNRLRSDWQACVARELVTSDQRAAPAPAASAAPTAASAAVATTASAALAAASAAVATASSAVLAAAASARLPVLDERNVVFAVTFGAGVSLMLLMISLVSSYAAERPIPPALQRIGQDFLTAFAIPLVDPTSAVPPVAGRLRFIRRTKRLEICIAPNGGRRYPNLSDHRKNVIYDVQRVIRNMGANRIVCDRLHSEGQWVIVSIRLAEPKQAGAK